MPIYKNHEGTSNKQWEYTINGLSVYFEWGRIGGTLDNMTKTFGSSHELQAALQKLIRDKEKKGYKLTNKVEMKAETKTAKELGVENKISRLQWVGLKGKTLNLLHAYDPSQWIYVEVMNSYRKDAAITRLLMNRTETWVLSGAISEFNRKITFGQKEEVYGQAVRFANAVRTKLKELANTITESIKQQTVKFAALGHRSLFDDDKPTAESNDLLAQLPVSGCDLGVVSKFAALGQRALEL